MWTHQPSPRKTARSRATRVIERLLSHEPAWPLDGAGAQASRIQAAGFPASLLTNAGSHKPQKRVSTQPPAADRIELSRGWRASAARVCSRPWPRSNRRGLDPNDANCSIEVRRSVIARVTDRHPRPDLCAWTFSAALWDIAVVPRGSNTRTCARRPDRRMCPGARNATVAGIDAPPCR
jgi:hypothetical protein